MSKERLTIKRLDNHGRFGFARRDDGTDVFLDQNIVRIAGLYVGREVYADVFPSNIPGGCPVARNIQFDAPTTTEQQAADHIGELPANLGKALGGSSSARWGEQFELAQFEMGSTIEH